MEQTTFARSVGPQPNDVNAFAPPHPRYPCARKIWREQYSVNVLRSQSAKAK
jgi:hypothetical protein